MQLNERMKLLVTVPCYKNGNPETSRAAELHRKMVKRWNLTIYYHYFNYFITITNLLY